MDFSQFQGPLARALRQIFRDTTPDPWPEEIDAAVKGDDAKPVCLNCLQPQERHYWFCKDCGFPGGEYMTVMPFLHIFTLGEMLRRGVLGKPERNIRMFFGLFVVSCLEFGPFAPVYWYWIYRKEIGRPICDENRPQFEEPATKI